MPDWTYQTIFRPAIFALGAYRGVGGALGAIGALARLPLGPTVIQLMGHMKTDPRLAVELGGLRFPTRVGLGALLDPHLSATPGFAQFGFGFLEVGPIVANPAPAAGSVTLDAANETLRRESPSAALTPVAAGERLRKDGPFRLPVLARIEPASAAEARNMLNVLGASVDGFVAPLRNLEPVFQAADSAGEKSATFLLALIETREWGNAEKRGCCLRAIREGRLAGAIIVESAAHDGARQIGKTGFAAALETVRDMRAESGPQAILVGAAGIHSPADALDYLEAGADLVQVDSGLVFAGPGLPKRINEAVLYRHLMTQHGARRPPPARVGEQAWFWAMLMALSMLVGGVMAMIVATTRVVLPYDEAMSGLTREQLAEVNERLLAFMQHDRVTLAGTMLAVGIQYAALAWWGIRRGVHWAWVSVIVSAFAGFLSFFSFLGFGYFDPFHAFVTAVLFQFLLLTIHARLPARWGMEAPDLWNDRRWKANQWGQLLFVIHGAVLIVAGLVISSVGMTTVFVHEDLEFMETTAERLYGAHPQLVPLVAHDRATFGGMLISCGVATLLPAMWGFRRGQAWLWWSLMAAGTIAYIATILVHMLVGYHSLEHLLPAYGGFALLWIAGLASFGFLAARDPRLEAEWERRLGAGESLGGGDAKESR
jgi:dihydroorotate dehydrogenase